MEFVLDSALRLYGDSFLVRIYHNYTKYSDPREFDFLCRVAKEREERTDLCFVGNLGMEISFMFL